MHRVGHTHAESVGESSTWPFSVGMGGLRRRGSGCERYAVVDGEDMGEVTEPEVSKRLVSWLVEHEIVDLHCAPDAFMGAMCGGYGPKSTGGERLGGLSVGELIQGSHVRGKQVILTCQALYAQALPMARKLAILDVITL
jgi:hypothetical protein